MICVQLYFCSFLGEKGHHFFFIICNVIRVTVYNYCFSFTLFYLSNLMKPNSQCRRTRTPPPLQSSWTSAASPKLPTWTFSPQRFQRVGRLVDCHQSLFAQSHPGESGNETLAMAAQYSSQKYVQLWLMIRQLDWGKTWRFNPIKNIFFLSWHTESCMMN